MRARNLAWPPGVLETMEPRNFWAWVIWNTFLAIAPVVLAQVISRMAGQWKRTPTLKILAALLGLGWLALLPNTCYLLTEWRHYLLTLDADNLYLRSRLDSNATLWLMIYTAFYFCYSAVGMLAFALAIRPMAQLLKSRGYTAWIWGIPFFLLMSVGVYLGLILRYNSWDLITRPSEVWNSVLELTRHPLLVRFIVVFGGFLWLAYTAIDIWIDGFIGRWKKTAGR